ncbi:MAG: PAC2 family protein [Dehalococcoidia bacterium]|nr:MAG: PAC2 family protein [Dehalococcoidia bacterium]
MRLHAFELSGPLPELKNPHVLAVLKPWIDVGNAASLALFSLRSHLNAADLGKIARPGNFFDFTRYRPMLSLKEGRREVSIPNTTVAYAKSEEGHDYLFLHILEPHMLAEVYIDSILQLLQRYDVSRYILVGSMYDMVPFTRPLLVTGYSDNEGLQNQLEAADVIPSTYEGPTTIAYLITQQAQTMGIETLSLIVHLPQYLLMENDYRGKKRLMEVLCSLYDLPLADEDADKAQDQHDQVRRIAEQYIQQEPSYELILRQLEAHYDSRVKRGKEGTKLSPEVERFLQDMGRRFGQN